METVRVAGAHGDMDGEHRVQFGLLMALEDGARKGDSKEEMAKILEQLEDYTKVHFMAEQMLMRLYQYPDLDGHEAEHDKLVEQLEEISKEFAASSVESMAGALGRLRQWLGDHIRNADGGFSRYLRDNGLGKA